MITFVQRDITAWIEESGIRIVVIPAEVRLAASVWPRNLSISWSLDTQVGGLTKERIQLR
jgi:hypothetical protein